MTVTPLPAGFNLCVCICVCKFLKAPSLEPASIRLTTIGRLGPSPAERVDRVTSKKKCFSFALGHTLVVLEMH